MLVDAIDDREFQRYLDRTEQALYVEMTMAMQATIRIHVNRNGLQAEQYLTKRGGDLLFHYYRKIYCDQYNAVTSQLAESRNLRNLTALEIKAAGQNNFLAEQEAYLRRRAGQKIIGISENLRQEISQLILEKVREGKSSQEIAKEIVKLSPSISKRRAAVIARTETHNSALAAIDASLKYKNVTVATKTWWSAGDDRVRPSHKEARGQTVNYSEPFNVGGSRLQFPGDDSLGADPGETINCRCAVLFSTEEAAPEPIAAPMVTEPIP